MMAKSGCAEEREEELRTAVKERNADCARYKNRDLKRCKDWCEERCVHSN